MPTAPRGTPPAAAAATAVVIVVIVGAGLLHEAGQAQAGEKCRARAAGRQQEIAPPQGRVARRSLVHPCLLKFLEQNTAHRGDVAKLAEQGHLQKTQTMDRTLNKSAIIEDDALKALRHAGRRPGPP